MTSISGMGGCGGAMAGYAGGIGSRRPPSFEDTDTDASGGISLEEFKAAGPKAPGGNSSRAGSTDRASDLFGKIDSDGDGSISDTEFSAFQTQMQSQMQSAMLSMQEQGGGRGGPPPVGPPPGGPPPGAHAGGGDAASNIVSLLQSLDADSSGTVSSSEFGITDSSSSTSDTSDSSTSSSSGLSSLFSSIDSDSDGSLSKEELQSFATTLASQLEQAMSRASQAYGTAMGYGADQASSSVYRLAA